MSATTSPERAGFIANMVTSIEALFDRHPISIWRVQAGGLTPVYGFVESTPAARAGLRRLFRRHAEGLRSGRVARAEGALWLPLVTRRQELVGLAQVPGETAEVNALARRTVAEALRALADLLSAPDEHSLEELLGPPDLDVDQIMSVAGPEPEGDELATLDAETDLAARELREKQRRRLAYHLQVNEWNVSKTARGLHWSRTKMWHRMRDLGLRRDEPAPTDPRRRRLADVAE